MNTSLAEIAAAIGVPMPPEAQDRRIDGVTTDSRAACSGKLFVALTGTRFDGHDFVAAALTQGAVAAMVSAAQTARRCLPIAFYRYPTPWRHWAQSDNGGGGSGAAR